MAEKLFKSTATVGGMTLISRVLGLVRDIIFARIFGAGAGMDAFFVAFKIPNFLRRLFAEGAFAQSFVPVLSEYKSQREHGEVRALVAAVSGTLGSILLLISLVAMLGAPLLVSLFAPGFLDQPDKYALTTDLLRITFPYLLFISLTAMAGGVLNSYGRFAIPAFTPVWLNLSLIGMALWGAPLFEQPVMALAWGVFIAGIAQLLFQFPSLRKLHLLVRPRWGRQHEGVKRIMKLMLPAIFGSSVAQINLLLDTIIASFLITGSVSWLYYSDRLVEFPLGVFGIALATVILPSLSRQHSESSPEAFSRTLDWALRLTVLIGAPATIGLVLLAGPMLTTLFHYGAFVDEDARMATLSLMAYGFGLLGFILVKVLAPGYYARQDTKTPVRIGIYAMVTNMVLNIVFVVPMVINDVSGPHAGLALATSVAAFVNAGLLFLGLRKQGIYKAEAGWLSFGLRILLAVGLMAMVLLWLSAPLNEWFAMGVMDRISQLLILIVVGAASYFASLYLLGIRPGMLKGIG